MFSGTLQQILQFLGRLFVMWFGRLLNNIEQKYIGRTDFSVAWILYRHTTLTPKFFMKKPNGMYSRIIHKLGRFLNTNFISERSCLQN